MKVRWSILMIAMVSLTLIGCSKAKSGQSRRIEFGSWFGVELGSKPPAGYESNGGQISLIATFPPKPWTSVVLSLQNGKVSRADFHNEATEVNECNAFPCSVTREKPDLQLYNENVAIFKELTERLGSPDISEGEIDNKVSSFHYAWGTRVKCANNRGVIGLTRSDMVKSVEFFGSKRPYFGSELTFESTLILEAGVGDSSADVSQEVCHAPQVLRTDQRIKSIAALQ